MKWLKMAHGMSLVFRGSKPTCGADAPVPLKTRVKLAVHVLRGRPLAFRMGYGVDSTSPVTLRPDTWIAYCNTGVIVRSTLTIPRSELP